MKNLAYKLVLLTFHLTFDLDEIRQNNSQFSSERLEIHLYALNCVYSRLIWYRVLNLNVIWNSFPHQRLIPEQWKASLTMHLPLKINSFICWGILCLHFYLLTKLVYVLISVFVVTFCGFLFAIGSSENVWPEPR